MANMHSKSASLSAPSSICTMGETIYLYSLPWWHCIGIKKHVLCNSSDNIILNKDIPKTPPQTILSYYPQLLFMSLVMNLHGICFPRVARTWLPCLSLVHCFVWPFLLERKILHHSIIHSSWRAVQESSSGVCLRASSSSGGIPSCMQRISSFHLSRKTWFRTACVTLSSLNHPA